MYSPKRRFRLFRHPAWAPAASSGGSISFSSGGAVGSALNFANSTGYYNIPNGTPFTIEWFQYLTTGAPLAPRSFQIGNYLSTTYAIGVSMEGSDPNRIFYLWERTRGPLNVASFSSLTPLVNTWVHFALVGDGTNIQVYRNGAKLGTTKLYPTSGGITSTLDLAIGNETAPSTTAAFNGYITNFRWVTGTAVYTDTFSTPTSPLTAIAGTQLLLLATSSGTVATDSGPNARTATTTGTVEWVSNSPFSA
jgi:hypothetical protein